MKKLTLVMAFVAAFGVTVMAQDTIATDTLKSSYFHNRWFDQDTLLLSQNGYVSFHFSELAFAYPTPGSTPRWTKSTARCVSMFPKATRCECWPSANFI